ncbi:hypothetical protein J2857_001291 [Neorhizobium galegae]|nr:hypothetical protein [Neorhizobium galegae]
MYTQLAGTVASATHMAGSVSAAEMTRGRVAADLSAHLLPAVFYAPLLRLFTEFPSTLPIRPGLQLSGWVDRDIRRPERGGSPAGL